MSQNNSTKFSEEVAEYLAKGQANELVAAIGGYKGDATELAALLKAKVAKLNLAEISDLFGGIEVDEGALKILNQALSERLWSLEQEIKVAFEEALKDEDEYNLKALDDLFAQHDVRTITLAIFRDVIREKNIEVSDIDDDLYFPQDTSFEHLSQVVAQEIYYDEYRQAEGYILRGKYEALDEFLNRLEIKSMEYIAANLPEDLLQEAVKNANSLRLDGTAQVLEEFSKEYDADDTSDEEYDADDESDYGDEDAGDISADLLLAAKKAAYMQGNDSALEDSVPSSPTGSCADLDHVFDPISCSLLGGIDFADYNAFTAEVC